jgi:hypothetical protein
MFTEAGMMSSEVKTFSKSNNLYKRVLYTSFLYKLMRLPYGHDVLGGQGNLKTQKLVQKLRETAIENRSRTYLLVLATSRLPVSLRNLRRTSFLTIIRLRDFLNWSIVYCGFFLLPYARHYNPWFVYFLPTF